MRGRAWAGGQVRPESRLCVAAGSGNTTLHCGTHPYTHTYCTCWRYWRGFLGRKKQKTLKTVKRLLVSQRQRSNPTLTDFLTENCVCPLLPELLFFFQNSHLSLSPHLDCIWFQRSLKDMRMWCPVSRKCSQYPPEMIHLQGLSGFHKFSSVFKSAICHI